MTNLPRILVITPRFPYPVYGGDILRIFHICRYLSEFYDLSLLSICQTPEEHQAEVPRGIFSTVRKIPLTTWQSYIQSVKGLVTGHPIQTSYYSSRAFTRAFNEMYTDFDMVLVHLARLAQYVEDVGEIPVLLELTDSVAMNYYRAKSIDSNGRFSLRKMVYSIEAPRILRYEKALLRRYDHISLVSETDREFLASQGADVSAVKVIPNGVDTERLEFIGPGDDLKIIFIGNMRTLQNQDACRYFIRKILPELRERLPGVRLKIIGNESDKFVRKLQVDETVTATGRVEEIAPETRGAFCAISVMRIGAGMQNKVLEYMAYGIPVVANDITMQGIGATPDLHYLQGKTPGEIADRIQTLYTDRNRKVRLAENARRFVEKNFRWEAFLQQYREMVEDGL